MHEINDPYCYPGTEVLKNKLGIQDEEELLETEKIIFNIYAEYIIIFFRIYMYGPVK